MNIDLRDTRLSADAVAEALELTPHPEGGRYRETWRDEPGDGTGDQIRLNVFANNP